MTVPSTLHRDMAVRLFEGKDHAAAYLQYRVAPLELISRIMSYMEKKVSLNASSLALTTPYKCLCKEHTCGIA